MLPDKIRALRLERGLTQTELARRLNVSKQSLSNWENDNILPSVEAVTLIARFFGVSIDSLLGLDERTYIEVTGLTRTEIAHIQMLIDDLRNRESSK